MMTPPELALDAVLVTMLAVLAWRTLTARDLLQAAVLFITFGLTMALAWARLAAPDLALAEAAVGAGLTGVLLVHVARAVREGGEAADKDEAEAR
jgi:energy-converting hydrogenase B subunit D